MSVRAFNWAKDVLETTRLTSSQRLVLLGLCQHHHHQTGACFPSIEALARYAGLSPRRARTALRDLEDVGLISTVNRVVKGGQQSNLYHLFSNEAGGRQRPPGNAKAGGRGGPAGQDQTGGTLASANREDSIREKEPRQGSRQATHAWGRSNLMRHDAKSPGREKNIGRGGK